MRSASLQSERILFYVSTRFTLINAYFMIPSHNCWTYPQTLSRRNDAVDYLFYSLTLNMETDERDRTLETNLSCMYLGPIYSSAES